MAEEATAMETSLGLVGDGDEIYLLEDVETLFDIKLDDAGVGRVMNVGDLFDLIMDVGGFRNQPTGCCYSQRGFYRLRRRIHLLGSARKITPKTRVRDILDELGMTYAEFATHMSPDFASVGMPCPQVPHERIWILRCLLAASVLLWIPSLFLAGALVNGSGLFLIGFFGFALFVSGLYSWFQTDLPHCCESVGDLARVYGAACFDEDEDALRKASAADIWDRLCACLRSENGYGGLIDRQTGFFGEQGEYPAPR